MREVLGWLWTASFLFAGLAHSAPVDGIYLHSAALAKQADAIDAAVQGTTTLKPYDDQLANLTTFANKEDFAVATRLAAERDVDLARLIGQPPDDVHHQDARAKRLLGEACQELANVVQSLAPSASAPPNTPCDGPGHQLNVNWLKDSVHLERGIEQQAEAQAAMKAAIQRFARLYPELPTPDCGGAAVEETTEAAQVIPNAVADLKDLADSVCARVKAVDTQLRTRGWSPVDTSIGGQVMQASKADQQAAASTAAAALKLLQTQLDAVQKATKAKTDVAGLKQIEDDLQTALSELDPVVKLAKLTKVQDELDSVAAVLTCGTTCTAPPAGSVGVKAVAVIGLMNALAQNADVGAGRGAVSNWIAAAQAIVGSYAVDAQTEAAAVAAMTAITTQRQLLAANEVALLSRAALLAAGDFDNAEVSGCIRATAFDCALPAYVDSWNGGRAPAAVLEYRQVQVFRAFVVQRQRQAAQAQRSLLLAATAMLKAYGDGGVQPQVIAQLIGALGIVGIAAK